MALLRMLRSLGLLPGLLSKLTRQLLVAKLQCCRRRGTVQKSMYLRVVETMQHFRQRVRALTPMELTQVWRRKGTAQKLL